MFVRVVGVGLDSTAGGLDAELVGRLVEAP